jgi:hypothetical protein
MKHTAHRVEFEHSNVFVCYLRYLDKRMPSNNRNNIAKNALIRFETAGLSQFGQGTINFMF